jgi:hypothetical protein
MAEHLADVWHRAAVAPVFLGGVQYESEKNPYPLEFVPGRYIRGGYTFTSRGCPRKCWFCSVWKRRPVATPIPNFPDGWNVLDDNLLAAPEPHVRSVFAMLQRQKRRVAFTGGLEAAALQDYQVDLLASLHPKPLMFWAYDPGDPFETLELAAKRMLAAGFTRASHRLCTYVLIGYPRDTFSDAQTRLNQMLSIGFTPMAMLWQPETPAAEKWRPSPEWRRFQRLWARRKIIYANASERNG